MVRYLKHSEINKARWDQCIRQSSNGLIYAYSWYLDIAAPGWEALIGDDYKSVLPLTCKKKYNLSYIYPPYFIQQLGLFSVKQISQDHVQQFLDNIPKHYKFIEYNLNWKNNFEIENFSVKENLTHHLNLSDDYHALASRYSQNLKRNLKKAQSFGLTEEKKETS